MFSKIKALGKKIKLSSFELKIILVAVVVIVVLQILMFSKARVVFVVDGETGTPTLETRINVSKQTIKAKIRSLSAEDKAWLKKEFDKEKQ